MSDHFIAADVVAELQAAWSQPDARRLDYGRHRHRPIALTDQDQPIPDGTQNPMWDIVRWFPSAPRWDDDSPLEPKIYPDNLGSSLKRFEERGMSRNGLCKRYAWSICTPGDVAWIAKQLDGRPVVEIGAGSGYWAWQLEQAGIDVVAYDPNPVASNNEYCLGGPYTTVLAAGFEALAQHPDRVLLMVWPPHEGAHATQALRLYCGDLLLYAGEGWGGCTADDEFYDLLYEEWDEVATAPDHVTWSGIHCSLRAYRRKTSELKEI